MSPSLIKPLGATGGPKMATEALVTVAIGLDTLMTSSLGGRMVTNELRGVASLPRLSVPVSLGHLSGEQFSDCNIAVQETILSDRAPSTQTLSAIR